MMVFFSFCPKYSCSIDCTILRLQIQLATWLH